MKKKFLSVMAACAILSASVCPCATQTNAFPVAKSAVILMQAVEDMYVAYDFYQKNSYGKNSAFVNDYIMKTAKDAKNNTTCSDNISKVCMLKKNAAFAASYTKALGMAEACVLTQGEICPKSVKQAGRDYISENQLDKYSLNFVR